MTACRILLNSAAARSLKPINCFDDRIISWRIRISVCLIRYQSFDRALFNGMRGYQTRLICVHRNRPPYFNCPAMILSSKRAGPEKHSLCLSQDLCKRFFKSIYLISFLHLYYTQIYWKCQYIFSTNTPFYICLIYINKYSWRILKTIVLYI